MAHHIKCGHCTGTHTSPAAVRACSQGTLFACHWMVQDYNEDGVFHRDCGAEATATDRGWTCAAGHQPVTAEARHAEGWDYAEEYGEALAMARTGIEPLTMSGHLVLGPQSFAPAV